MNHDKSNGMLLVNFWNVLKNSGNLDEDLHRVHHVHHVSSLLMEFPAKFVTTCIRLPAERMHVSCGFFECIMRALGFVD